MKGQIYALSDECLVLSFLGALLLQKYTDCPPPALLSNPLFRMLT